MAKPVLYTRRNLLKLFGSLPLVSLLPTSSLAENLQELGRQTGRRRLIILELFGGNDALNTLIPYRDPLYRRYRPNLAISPKDWISLNDELAFNPSFKPLGELYQRGELAVIPDAGYPNPSLSHFDSTAIWNTGYVDTAQRSGWAGRTIAANRSWAAPHDANGIVFSGSPAFLQEEGIRALELQDTNALMSSSDMALRPAVQVPNSATHYIRSLIENHRDISQRIRQKLNRPNPFERLFRSSEYGYLEPVYVQGAQLLWLIACNVDTPVFKLGMPGFDLHGSMNELHRPLLHQVATLLMGLRRGLMDIGTWQDTLILVQSEFGRRPEENASGGTDHGTSGVALLLGGALSGGIYGSPSDLGKLDEAGNPYFTTDFRRIYSSIVTDFWRLPHNPLRNEGFEPLALRLSA
ncbi:DUF1501 domain-containing protein [Dickeya fangzhongdai]|uniref:DUF1501 domain-containing protein n=1 Tax=Dickeya fangzhongdai TaxID=1778540 RepID=UPI0026E0CD06|nr:DUF1501 domain-containing protein [Dickeya fangzhongdai]WKV52443.1 DUF1501 domain-containing protein [Dickeya fangzhongdai]